MHIFLIKFEIYIKQKGIVKVLKKMEIKYLLLIFYFIYYVKAYTDEISIYCPKGSNIEMKECLVRVRNKVSFNKKEEYTDYLAKDYLKCNTFGFCPPTQPAPSDKDCDSINLRVLCVEKYDDVREKCNCLNLKTRDMVQCSNFMKYSFNIAYFGIKTSTKN